MKVPELKAADFAEYLLSPTDEDSRTAIDAYSHLGGFCFQAYASDNLGLRTESVRHGFNVVARLIRYGAKLYPEYSQSHDSANANTDDLRNILLNSSDTPVRFAAMPNDMNRIVEFHFGLTTDQPAADMRHLYKFEPNTTNGTLFIADDEAFYKALRDAEHESPMTSHIAGNQCPMRHVTKDIIWPTMVNLAADTPEAFALDLAAERTVA